MCDKPLCHTSTQSEPSRTELVSEGVSEPELVGRVGVSEGPHLLHHEVVDAEQDPQVARVGHRDGQLPDRRHRGRAGPEEASGGGWDNGEQAMYIQHM